MKKGKQAARIPGVPVDEPYLSDLVVERTIIEPDWAGQVAVIMASGPSLCAEDIAKVRRSGARTIVCNRTWEMAPWADIHYATDRHFWIDTVSGQEARKPRPGRSFMLSQSDQAALTDPSVHWIEPSRLKPGPGLQGKDLNCGFDDRPWRLRPGKNSGYAITHIAMHKFPDMIVLLGFDMKKGPYGEDYYQGHDGHRLATNPDRRAAITRDPTLRMWGQQMAFLAEAMTWWGTPIVNASRDTSIECFPRVALEEVLP